MCTCGCSPPVRGSSPLSRFCRGQFDQRPGAPWPGAHHSAPVRVVRGVSAANTVASASSTPCSATAPSMVLLTSSQRACPARRVVGRAGMIDLGGLDEPAGGLGENPVGQHGLGIGDHPDVLDANVPSPYSPADLGMLRHRARRREIFRALRADTCSSLAAHDRVLSPRSVARPRSWKIRSRSR